MLLALAAFTIAGCKKDDEGSVSPDKQGEALIGTWVYTAVTSDTAVRWQTYPDTVVGTDGLSYRPCLKESTLTFNEGTTENTGHFLLYDNCDKSSRQDTWILQNSVLSVAGDDFTVEQLNKSVMRLSFPHAIGGGRDTKVTCSFKKK